jgi:hypothetical protein
MRPLVVLALASSVWLSGCASIAQDRLYRDYAAKSLSKDATASYVTLTTALQAGQGPEGKDAPLVPSACFGVRIEAAQAATCTAQRNQAIAALVIGSDELCVDHRKTIYGNEASWNISLGTLTNLFAGAAAVVTAEKSKTLLAALALFSNSERSLINETVYKQMLITAVDRKIVEMRDTRMQAVYVALKQDINAYTMHEALRDVIALHSTCSFMNGLQKALEEGTQAGAAQRILRLKASLQSATTELAALSALPDKEQAGRKPYADGLAARITAISTALAAEEAK